MRVRSFRNEPDRLVLQRQAAPRMSDLYRRQLVNQVIEDIHQIWLQFQQGVYESDADLIYNILQLLDVRDYIIRNGLQHELIPDQDIASGERVTLLEYLDQGDLMPLYAEFQRRQRREGNY